MGKSAAKGQGLKYLALTCICVMSFSIRLFSIIKYESVIHEFDPYFNYRVTQFLTKDGFYEWWNWFDDRTWYPLGRVIGGTTYPGLIFTAGMMHNVLHFFNFPLHVQEVCVLTAPLFSAFCSLASFGLVKEIRGEGAGLLAAAFVGVVPSYISRSVAGSFDNEGVAIFALVNVFQCFLKTVNTGSLFWSMLTVLSYFYMVASWGGYSFIINLLPIYVLACIFTGRLSSRLYIAFVPIVAVGTLMSLSIPVVGFNAVLMSEHFGAFFACAVLHAALLVRWVRGTLNEKQFWLAVRLVVVGCGTVLAVAALVLITSVINHPTFGWTGRSLSLLDPTYAGRFIPIIASVSEHQPPSWPSYINDLHILAIVTPLGIMACFYPLTDASLFLVLYGVTAAYFSGVMVRLMLVLAPAVCCLAAVAIHTVLDLVCASLKAPPELHTPPTEEAVVEAKPEKKVESKKGKKTETKVKSKKSSGKGTWRPIPFLPASIVLVLNGFLLTFYMTHCIWAAADMYSAPSIVLQSQRPDGSLHVFDDFREAYAWLRHNTHPETKVASWWDYGYQTTAMANRTVVVDNNTWNTTHIATVGRAMSSKEGKAWKIYRSLDVEYVFVVFGGLVGYPSDDINKFLWMVRIGGGVYPEIKESDYLTNGDYTVAQGASPTMLNSLMYKLSYYQFPEVSEITFGQRGMDRVRGYQIGKLNVNLKYFEEVFTSQHWMMRIYRVRDAPNRVGSGRKKKA